MIDLKTTAMQRKKELFELFQDNQHRLDRSPSNASWRKLERRLETHQQRTRRHTYRTLGMVAGIVVLLASVFLFYVALAEQMGNRHQDLMLQVEELSATEIDPSARLSLEYTRQYDEKAVEEGRPDGKLVVRP